MKHVLLISGSDYSKQVYGGLISLRDEGIQVSLLSDGSFEPTPGVFEHHVKADLRHTAATLDRVRGLDLRFDAVVNKSSEWLTPLTALLAQHFGVLGVQPKVAFLCRSKLHMRQAFKEAGLPTPRFRLCHSFEEIQETVREFNTRCVAKPIGGNASYGTFQVQPSDNFDALGTYYLQAVDYLRKKAIDQDMFAFEREELRLLGIEDEVNMVDDYLVEEFLVGTQVSVDSLIQNGRPHVAGVAHQIRMKPPFFVQVEEYMPFQGDSETLRGIEEVNRRSLEALGVEVGTSHTEIILTEEGPRVLEVACRIGGDNIHDSVYQTTGVHLLKESIYVHLGIPRKLKMDVRAGVAMRYFIPEKKGILQRTCISPELYDLPYVTDLNFSATSGERVSLPPESYDFLGYIQVCGQDVADAREKLEHAVQYISFDIADVSE
ncbi:MAG: ATP-grasp domain-containing protein [Bdellovibrionales bacterium]|nr:ATP-grasp domain-containing protein [Bdellovibrionales bacterium]